MFWTLKTLNKKLWVEEIIGPKLLQQGAISTIEVFFDSSVSKRKREGKRECVRERDYWQKKYALYSESIYNAKEYGNCTSTLMAEAMNINHEQDQKELKN